MKMVLSLLVVLTLSSCEFRHTNWPHFPEDIPLKARIRVGEESQVLANLFTLEEAVRARVWISTAGVWTFIEMDYVFDDRLDNITPEDAQLRFHALGQDAVELPLPPGLTPIDFPEFQVELGGDEEINTGLPLTARFVPSADPGLLAIRHTTETSDRLLKLSSGARAWSEEELPSGLEDIPIRSVGPEIALLQLEPDRAGIFRNGEVVEASTLLTAFEVSTESPFWLGPFDGSSIRVFWSEEPEVLCTGVVDVLTYEGSLDGCLEFGTPHAGVVQASGEVEDTAAVVYEMDFNNNTRMVMTRAQQGKFELLGMGGYSGYRSWTPAKVFAAVPARPNITDRDCELDADLYSVSSFFQVDGTFGFNRCPVSLPTDICECSRSDTKSCACSPEMVKPQWILRTGDYTHTIAGWHKQDSRLILRAYGHETDRQNGSTLDPTDELQEHPGVFSFETQIAIEGHAPGYQTSASELTNLTHCSSVVGNNGAVPRNPNDTFTVDTRESYTVSVECDPNDGGPPLEPYVAHFDWSMAVGLGFRFDTDVSFARGLPVDMPLNALVSVHPAEPWLVASSGTSHVRIGMVGGALDVVELPASQGRPQFLAFGQARFDDGRLVDLHTGALLGTLPSGRTTYDHRFWFGDDRSIWVLANGQAPVMLVVSAGHVFSASTNGDYIAADAQGVWAYDAQGFPAQLYSVPGRVTHAAISEDGKYAAIETSRLGAEPPYIRVFARDDNAPELAYAETFTCENCAMMQMVPSTAELVYSAEQGRVETLNPESGVATVLNTGFTKSVPGAIGLAHDYFGRFWWIVEQDLLAYDPTTGDVFAYAIDLPGGDLNMGTFHIEHHRFEGYSRGLQVYGVDENGLRVVYQELSDTSLMVTPLAGNRGHRGGYFGVRNAESTDLIDAIEMSRGSATGDRVPREQNLPCVLIQRGPFPNYITSLHSNYVCAR